MDNNLPYTLKHLDADDRYKANRKAWDKWSKKNIIAPVKEFFKQDCAIIHRKNT